MKKILFISFILIFSSLILVNSNVTVDKVSTDFIQQDVIKVDKIVEDSGYLFIVSDGNVLIYEQFRYDIIWSSNYDNITEISVENNYMVISDSENLYLFNISDIFSPVYIKKAIVNSPFGITSVNDLEISNGLLSVSLYYEYFLYDVSDLSLISNIGYPMGPNYDTAIYNSTHTFTAIGSDGIGFNTISNTEIGWFYTYNPGNNPKQTHYTSISIDGDYLYAMDIGNLRVDILYINGSYLSPVSQIDISGIGTSDIYTFNSSLYLTNNEGVHVFNLQDIKNPNYIGVYKKIGAVNTVIIRYNKVIMGIDTDLIIEPMSIFYQNISTIAVNYNLPLINSINTSLAITDIKIIDNIAYTIENGTINSYNITGYESGIPSTKIWDSSSYSFVSQVINVYNNLLYVGIGYNLTVFDITNKYNPNYVDSIELYNGINEIEFYKNYAFIATNWNLKFINISYPIFQYENLENYAMGPVFDIAIDGNIIVSAASYDGLVKHDITDMNSIQTETIYTAYDITLVDTDGSYIYLYDNSNNRVVIFDENSQFISNYTIDYGQPSNMIVKGEYLFISVGDNIEVIDISDRYNPYLRYQTNQYGIIYDMELIADALVISLDTGIGFLNISSFDSSLLKDIDIYADTVSHGDTSISLFWDKLSYQVDMILQRRDGIIGKFINITNVYNNYIDFNVTAGIEYHYRLVFSYNGNSFISNKISVTIPIKIFTPLAPKSISLTQVTNGGVRLDWEAPIDSVNANITHYGLYKSTDGVNFVNIINASSGSVKSYIIMGLIDGETYYFKVTAINIHGESPDSDILSITIHDTPETSTQNDDTYVGIPDEEKPTLNLTVNAPTAILFSLVSIIIFRKKYSTDI